MSEKEMNKLTDESLDGVAGGRQSEISVAYDVIDGKYGNGEERYRRLFAAGYDPNAIQAIVNRILKQGNPPARDPYLDRRPRRPEDYQDPYLG